MTPFSFVRPDNVAQAVRELIGNPSAKAIAGGTNLVDLMKYHVERPTRVVDLTRLPLNMIDETDDGGLRIGALVSNTDLANDARVQKRYPMLASAIRAGASQQLRNAATTGGNLLQRTRCPYFYDVATPCNKREPGSGCPAIPGFNRYHAILGASAHCIATHPSDMCVALAALEARVRIAGPDETERVLAFSDFHRLPGDTPEIDTALQHGEIIVSIDLPPDGFARHHTYLKLRDRHSYAFALVSIAAALELQGDRVCTARLALGGVAHKPWRDPEAEALLVGRAATTESFRAAADVLLRDAKGLEHNAFKIELARRGVVRALSQAAAATHQSQVDKRIH
jgi:xanthine dehydrogenase YagS FAD-binding subunit